MSDSLAPSSLGSSGGGLLLDGPRPVPALPTPVNIPTAIGEPEHGINLWAILSRRWPLLALGLAFGALVGTFAQITGTPVYQSTAQLLVIQSRSASTGSSDSRTTEVQDYVSAQLVLIKSEKVRKAAAQELRSKKLSFALPEDNGQVAAMIAGGMSAVRDRDSTPGTVGNGVVILGYAARDPSDSMRILEAIVKAYQNELAGVYDTATNERRRYLQTSIDASQKDLQRLVEKGFEKQTEKIKITPEDLGGIRTRVGAQRDKLIQLQQLLIGYERDLDLISKAGPNDSARQKVLVQLTGEAKTVLTQAGQPGLEQTLRSLKVQRDGRSATLGKDHPTMKALALEIAFYEAELARLNPDKSASLDQLGAYELRLKNEKEKAELTVKQIKEQLDTDEKKLQAAGKIEVEIEANKAAQISTAAVIQKDSQELRTVELTSTKGGFDARELTPPGFGGKIGPKVLVSAVIGLLTGLAAGALGMTLAELTDRSFKSPAEIRRRLGLPVIGHIPQLRLDEPPDSPDAPDVQPALVCALRTKSAEAEAYRGLRTQLYFSTQGRGHQIIQVTSPNPGDGKSTLAANLAVSIAQSGKRTVLIDCDMRKPQVHRVFKLGQVEVGLAQVIAGTALLSRALRRSPIENLDLVPCGPRPNNPAELLTSSRFQLLLADLRDAYDFVIVDTPPVLAVSDPANVAPRVDGIIMVFRMTKFVRPAAERTREQLITLGANILGVVVNGGDRGPAANYSGYNYGSSSGYRYIDYEYAMHYDEEGEVAEAAEAEADKPKPR